MKMVEIDRLSLFINFLFSKILPILKVLGKSSNMVYPSRMSVSEYHFFWSISLKQYEFVLNNSIPNKGLVE